MSPALPIRIRLTLWYTAVLALCLAAFGMTVWFGLRESLIVERRSQLEGALQSVRAVVLEHAEAPDDELREEINELSSALPPDVSVQLSGSDGRLVFSTPRKQSDNVLDREETIPSRSRQYRVRLQISLGAIDGFLRQLIWILLLSIPIALMTASVGGYWLSGRALTPVREMAYAAQAIGASDLSSRLPLPSARDELRLLAEMWNAMLARLEGSVERIKRFTSDASHDLRTPLATIRASAEISLRKAREPVEYRHTMEAILGQANRATSLIEDLLTLARADQGGQTADLSVLDLSQIAADARDTLRASATAKGLHIHLFHGVGPILIRGNRVLLSRAVEAIVDNAIKYTNQGSVELRVGSAGELASLTVSDTGSGIDAVDLPHIFDRFYRGDKSRSSQGGFGLGLAIAKEAVALHHGAIDVASVSGEGARFTLSFPLAR